MSYDNEKEFEDELNNESSEENNEITENAVEEENITDNFEQTEEIKESSKGEESSGEDDKETSEYTSQFGELEGYVDDYNKDEFNNPDTAQITKKKGIQAKTFITIIVLVAVLVIALALGAYFVFFNNNIKGTWVQTTTDDDGTETKTYYVFGKNSLEIINADDYVYQKNKYTDVIYDEGTFSIMQDGNVYMRCSYTIEGNLIQGKTLTYAMEGYEDYSKIELKNTTEVPNSDELQGSEFEKNDSIVGSWKNNEVSGYVEYLVFDNKGKMTQYSADNSSERETVQKYNFDGSKLNFKYQDEEYSMVADIKDNVLSITTESIYMGEMILNYEKSTDDEFRQTREKLNAGEYEFPTSETPTEILVEEDIESATEQVSQENTAESSTENVTEKETQSVQ